MSDPQAPYNPYFKREEQANLNDMPPSYTSIQPNYGNTNLPFSSDQNDSPHDGPQSSSNQPLMMQNTSPYNPDVRFQNSPHLKPNQQTVNVQMNNSSEVNLQLAAQVRQLEIDANGRKPVTVYCDSCNSTVVTEIEEKPSQAMSDYTKSMSIYVFIFTTIVCIIPVFVFPDTKTKLIYLASTLGLIGAVFCCIIFCVAPCNANIYPDVYHKCPQCKSSFGFNDGKRHYQLYYQSRRI